MPGGRPRATPWKEKLGLLPQSEATSNILQSDLSGVGVSSCAENAKGQETGLFYFFNDAINEGDRMEDGVAGDEVFDVPKIVSGSQRPADLRH